MALNLRAEVSEGAVDLAVDTLSADLAKFMINQLREPICAFKFLSESEQAKTIIEAMEKAETVIAQVVAIIAGDGRQVVQVEIGKVLNDGKRIKFTCEASKSSNQRHAIFDAAGSVAFLSIADPAKFTGGDAPAADKDQGELME